MKRFIKPQSSTRKEALKKWRQYNDAVKSTDLQVYKDLKKIYTHLKAGKVVLDIYDAFQRAGTNIFHQPKLAIAQASAKTIYCRYDQDGSCSFRHEDNFWQRARKRDVVLMKNVLGKIPEGIKTNMHARWSLQAPVPITPPHLLPAKLTGDYYVLWEVDVWEPVPPKDPYLLRRITKNMFVVLGAWDLTRLEQSVMKAYM